MADTKLNLVQKLAKIRAISDVVSKEKRGYNYSYADITTILANITAGIEGNLLLLNNPVLRSACLRCNQLELVLGDVSHFLLLGAGTCLPRHRWSYHGNRPERRLNFLGEQDNSIIYRGIHMAENQNKLTIGFNFENEFGDKFSATTTAQVFNDLGETDIDFIGDQLNIFLKQCGYARKNDHIFMEDVTEEEWVALADYLEELRRSKEEGGDEE